jgi:hypothetical protein
LKAKLIILSLFLFIQVSAFTESRLSAQSLTGTTGLFHIPTAEMMADKTFMIGLTQIPGQYSLYGEGMHDNRAGYATLTFLPRVEIMFRYTHLDNWRNGPYGTYFPDRMIAVRVQVLREKNVQPAVLIGFHDLRFKGFSSHSFFGANYIVASKTFQPSGFIFGLHSGAAFDLFGEKSQTMKGLFGGISISHSLTPWANVIVEHDSRRLNAAVKLLFVNHLQVMAGLMDMKYPAGGVGLQIQL